MPQRRDHVLRHANTTTAARRSSRLRNASSHVYEVLIYDDDEEEWIPAVVQWMFFKDKSDKGNMPSRDQGSQLRAELCIKPGHYHAHYAFYSSAKASTGRTAVNSPDLWEGMSTDSNHPSPAHGEAVVCKTEHAEDGDHHNATPGEHPAQDTSTLSEPRRLAHHRARIHLHEAIPRAALCPLHASLRSAVDLLDISSEVQTYTSHSPAMASLCTSPAAGATTTVLSCPTTYHTATNASSVPAHVPSCGARSIPSLMEAPQTCRASTSHAARSMSKNQHHNADGEMLARFGDSISSVEELLEVYLCGVTLLVDPGVSSSSSSSLANSFFASTPNSPALTGGRGDGTSARKPTSRSGGFGGLQQRYARMKRSFLKLLEPSSQSSSPSGKASQASASFASPFIQHGAGEALPPQARVRCVLRCLSEEDLFSFLHDAVRAMGTGDGPDAPSDPAGRMMMMHQQRQRFLRRVDPPSLSSSLGDNVNDDEMDEDVGCGCLSLALRATQLDNPLLHPCLREANFDCWPCFVKYRRDPRHGVPFARVPPLLWHSYLDQAPRVLYTFQRGQLIVEEGSGGSSRLSTAAAAALAKGIQRTTNTNITSSSSSSTTTLMRSIGPENEVRTSSRLLHPTEERRRRGLGIEEAMRAEEHSAPLCLRDLSTSSEELRQPARFSDIFLSISESDVLFLNALGELKLHLALTDLTAVLWYAPSTNTRAHKPSSKSSAASRRRNSANAASTSSARSSCAFGGASASLKPFCCFKCRDGDGAGEPPLAFTFSFLPIYGSTLPHHLLDNPPLQPASPSLVAQRGISCPSDAELGDAPRAVIAALQALMGKRWTSMNLSDYLAHGEAAGLGVGGDGTKLASSAGANRSSWMAHAYGDLAPPRPPARTIFVELTAEEVSSMLRVADEEEGSAAEVLPAPRSSDGRPPLLRSYEVDGQRRRPSTTSMDSGNVRWTGESTPLSLSVVDSMSNPAAMVVTRPRSDGGLSSTQMELALRMAAHPMPLQLNKSDLFLFDEPEESEVGGSMAYADPSQKGKDAEEGDGLYAVVHPRRKG